ncbi:hypothetical protein SAMN05216368_1148 [Cryobacterium flavum]|uniref:J domain-containing protein n=1 Tax=Cryobacterium flavum TaxID=1424659 RepID=A0A4R8V4Y5_9MICO|nr:J domain-containing protein [Cryobacterium flavum]TFB76663.1 hypothetical protein E3O21_10945 [Cryobacterium flavum]SDO27441.1 hypothetical protein SAMN05216368_1148 [Cryobacterium flavum]
MTPEAAAAILNVDVFASKAEVEKAFKRGARLSHPDRFAGGSPDQLKAASVEFIRIAEAKAVLLDWIAERAARAAAASQAAASQPSGWSTGQASAPSTPGWSSAEPSAGAGPSERPLSFDEYLAAREFMAWNQNPDSATATATSSRPGAEPGAREPAPIRRFRLWLAFGATLGTGAVILVAVMLVLAYVDGVGSESHSGSDIYSRVVQKQVAAEVTTASECTEGSRCWVWELTPQDDCAQATLGISLFSESKDELRSVTIFMQFTAGESIIVAVPAEADGEIYASIQQMRCSTG